ncbi:hypothetical protein Scep_012058 [Stephania cephalantha]|uniref:Uncharacterized protein n=1 Tax=Stephania cephalantha TaxID=152367 RepID=A0AAP0JFB9_9MAGN
MPWGYDVARVFNFIFDHELGCMLYVVDILAVFVFLSIDNVFVLLLFGQPQCALPMFFFFVLHFHRKKINHSWPKNIIISSIMSMLKSSMQILINYSMSLWQSSAFIIRPRAHAYFINPS